MDLLFFLGGMCVGAGFYAKFGNACAKSWKRKLIKMIQANDELVNTVKRLQKHIRNIESGEHGRYMDEVRRGVDDAAYDMSFGDDNVGS